MLAALLSALFASCKDDNEDEAVVDRRNPNSNVISFSTYTAGATRAADVGSSDIKNIGFKVAAWYDGGLYFNTDETAKVTAADGFADTDGDTYYWPSLSAGEIGFRAFNISSDAAWNDEYNSVKFTVASSAADQKDLVIAYAKATSKPTDGVQPLNFTHALSKVNFSFAGAESEYTYTINRVEVIAAGGAATMAFAETTELGSTNGLSDGSQPETNTQNKKVDWTYTVINGDNPLVVSDKTTPANGGKAAQGVLYTYKTGDVVVNGTTQNDLSANFMLLPQSGKIAIRIYYKIENGDELKGNCGYTDTDGVYGCKTLIVDLGSDGIPAWQAGKSYRFIITLPTDNYNGDTDGDGVADDLDEEGNDLDGDGDKHASEFGTDKYIEFAVKVTSWGEGENVPATIIIK